MTLPLATLAAAVLLVGLAAFHAALALGAPWGAYAWGGETEGPLPPRQQLGSTLIARRLRRLPGPLDLGIGRRRGEHRGSGPLMIEDRLAEIAWQRLPQFRHGVIRFGRVRDGVVGRPGKNRLVIALRDRSRRMRAQGKADDRCDGKQRDCRHDNDQLPPETGDEGQPGTDDERLRSHLRRRRRPLGLGRRLGSRHCFAGARWSRCLLAPGHEACRRWSA